MTQTPLLILSDSPSASSGLGRIARDLALRLHEHCSDIFRVGTLGYGGVGSCSLPFPQYHMTETKDWMVLDLPQVWTDFVGKHEPGVIFTIWDPSRMLWFARPDQIMYCRDRRLREWLQQTPIKKWGYFPIDAAGPHDKLSCMQRECILGYDRVLSYTNWAKGIMERTLGADESQKRSLSHLPHGIDTDTFVRRDRLMSRRVFHDALEFKGPLVTHDQILIGIVATNQPRKDFGLAFQVVAELAKKLPIRLFIQTDTLERYWSIPALLMDYGLMAHTILNVGEVTDEAMSYIYTACDLTLGIGLGEGFGYPIFESLACGTPCITGSYGGQAEFMTDDLLIEPDSYRYEGLYNCKRPVFKPVHWVNAILKAMSGRKIGAQLPAALHWSNLWPRWEEYFREAHRSLSHPAAILEPTSSETGMGESGRGTPIGIAQESFESGEVVSILSKPSRV